MFLQWGTHPKPTNYSTLTQIVYNSSETYELKNHQILYNYNKKSGVKLLLNPNINIPLQRDITLVVLHPNKGSKQKSWLP